MRFVLVTILITALSGLASVQGQAVEFGNNETSDYGSSYKSSSFTYLMWDRNDDGDGNFSDSSTPKFFYWDNDASKLNFLLDTGNMSQLNAIFNSVGIGTTNSTEDLHVSGTALIDNSNRLYISRNANANNSGAIRYVTPYSNIGWSYPDEHERAMVFESYGYLDSYGAGGGGYLFKTRNGDDTKVDAMAIRRDGKVGIGTLQPSNKLTVNGTTKAEEVIVTEDVGADFVFEDDYNLPDLKEVETHIKDHKHLPEIPTAKEMKENGVKIGALQMKLLQKIEELTLYTLHQQEQIEALRKELKQLKEDQ